MKVFEKERETDLSQFLSVASATGSYFNVWLQIK